jgi:hypothetical protein
MSSRSFDLALAAGNGVTVLPDVTVPPTVNQVLTVTKVVNGNVQTGFVSPAPGGGTVTSVGTSGAGIIGGPITTSGTLAVQWNAGNVTALDAATLQLSAGMLTVKTTAMGAAGGDLTGTYPNPRLVTTGVSAGSYGDGSHVPQLTLDLNGRVTAATTVTIAGVPPSGPAGGGLSGSYPNPSLVGVPVASSTMPTMDGTAVVGTGTTWARADHAHPSDTSRAPLASPTFTGTVTAAGSRLISQGAGGNPSVAAYDTSDSAGRGFWVDGGQNMGFGPVNSAGVPTAQQFAITAAGGIQVQTGIGAFNATPPTTKPTVTGAKGSNAALASLLTALVAYGFITDSTTA